MGSIGEGKGGWYRRREWKGEEMEDKGRIYMMEDGKVIDA